MRNPEARADPAFDVAVLGGRLSAGLLAAVLARQGVRVLLVNPPGDLHAPAGETTVPYTAEVFRLLARRFEVPEIAAFGRFPELPARLRGTSGVNRGPGYLYHRPGRRQRPRECVRFAVPDEHAAWHPFLPNADRYALDLAAVHGAAVSVALLEDAGSDEDHAWVRAADGRLHRARFVVDAVGPGSPLVARNGGDDPTARLRHRSRVLATRMRDVVPFEDLAPRGRHRRFGPWSQGTVNHLFDGGWVQLVGFGNHAESRHPQTCVTLSVDPDRFDGLPADPDQAFHAVIGRFPDLARQFGGATAVVPWTDAPRWQRTAARTRGPRWFAMEPSASRNDPFLAREITTHAEIVHALAAALIHAVRAGDWSAEPFVRVARLQEELSRHGDRLLCAARTACQDVRLWSAFCRVWLVWQQLAHLSLRRARLAAEAAPDGDWSPVERYELGWMWFHAPAGLRELVARSLDAVDDVRAGSRTPGQAADLIFRGLKDGAFLPSPAVLGSHRPRLRPCPWRERLRLLR
ncbi:FADH2 O2-dependent halogenase [Streptomyces sp. yr375]|uniref:NAD(P)/FAD-dependent oxidoreductase n=1 Tax=Streptomyces sp. yr375 TaxID=1761906 RepID=UPI0008B92F2B|nr:hypothetical protein [Streptomyces sp. yr375]SEQ90218.1 FADH2 O2-dependent halogenase [Streptomyces sp. yr375]